ncbi:MAG: M48 family metallopeptidase [Gordonia sp. (in: high G+C Gram-positive bacteria)]|uniref:M48 family metallopeptidase n=1 Tax=Gordonia sp. (in: high G+C Gram-positive bacteria) TaxID=84139 RepID=UPI0039E50F94
MDSHAPIPSVPGIDDPAVPTPPSDDPGPGAVWLPPARFAGPPQRHPWEIPMLVIVALISVLAYLACVVFVVLGDISDYALLALLLPLIVFASRGLMYASQRVNGVQMSPTQFPEGYRILVETAARYGLEYIPDAYVVTGNGQINAFASGHGFRRFIVVYSDLFEIGGKARSPEALKFIIGHEVGHIAAGHVSYWRQLVTSTAMSIPILGSTLSRAQEYTADNHGYYSCPAGAPPAMGVLAAGKYMLGAVNFDEFADRATHERGFFVTVVNALASHPVLTWRAAALRDRTRAGAMLLRPKQVTRGTGSGNAVVIPTPPPPTSVPPGSLPNGLGEPPSF